MSKKTNAVFSWLLFAALGGLAAYLRYGGGLTPNEIAAVKNAAPYIVLGVHICILLLAYEDSMTQMLLCLLVPGYSLVYILLFCDRHMYRAVLVAVLIGTGQDAMMVYQKKLNQFIKGGHEVMEEGGGIYD